MAKSDINLDLFALYEQAYGSATEAFNPTLRPVIGDTSLTRAYAGSLGSPYYATDPKLGREYFMPVTVKFPNQTALGSKTTGVLNAWKLPFPFITIKASKTFIDTPLTERSGTVSELINIKNYEIRIRGFIISPTDDYPEADIVLMRNLFEVNSVISLRSVLTDIFLLRPDRSGSDSVTVRDLDFPGIKGVKNIESYELTIQSDSPFNLIDIS